MSGQHFRLLFVGSLLLLTILPLTLMTIHQNGEKKDSFLEFARSYASLDREVVKAVEEYRMVEGTEDADDAASDAGAAASEGISAMWELDAPENLPVDVKDQLQHALSSIRDSYHSIKFEMDTVHHLVEEPDISFLETQAQYFGYVADRERRESRESMIKAGDSLGFSREDMMKIIGEQ
ncbi:hypothetical protein ACUMHR_09640 [Rossellomorea marisflavi]|uniref:hypothetical protein n=1 Tax=Rossellomorea marisflavi TaxID=189381 RepID=UPI0040441220